jgi:hypothetical protein
MNIVILLGDKRGKSSIEIKSLTNRAGGMILKIESKMLLSSICRLNKPLRCGNRFV